MKIVFDLDQTLVDNRLHIAAAHLIGEEPKNPKRYDLGDQSYELMETSYKLYRDPSYMCTLPALDGVIDYIKSIKDKDLYILTARPRHLYHGTRFMIQALFGDKTFKDIIFVDSPKEKISILKNMEDLEVYVDDLGSTIVECVKENIPCVLIHNETTTYNSDEEVTSAPRVIKSVIEL